MRRVVTEEQHEVVFEVFQVETDLDHLAQVAVSVQERELGLQVVLEQHYVLVLDVVHQHAVLDAGVAGVEEHERVHEGVEGRVVLHHELHPLAKHHNLSQNPRLPEQVLQPRLRHLSYHALPRLPLRYVDFRQAQTVQAHGRGLQEGDLVTLLQLAELRHSFAESDELPQQEVHGNHNRFHGYVPEVQGRRGGRPGVVEDVPVLRGQALPQEGLLVRQTPVQRRVQGQRLRARGPEVQPQGTVPSAQAAAGAGFRQGPAVPATAGVPAAAAAASERRIRVGRGVGADVGLDVSVARRGTGAAGPGVGGAECRAGFLKFFVHLPVCRGVLPFPLPLHSLLAICKVQREGLLFTLLIGACRPQFLKKAQKNSPSSSLVFAFLFSLRLLV